MKYYSAVVSQDEIDACCVIPPNNILASYHYFKNKENVIIESIKKGFDVFIDSGAFSAMNSGKEIDINEYCLFLKRTGAIYYATLDVIGDAKKTLDNHKYMIKEHGLNPIPAFHMGSELKDLEPLLEYNYIALGGLVFSSGILNHCDLVWDYLLKNKPNIKVHGFGLTNIELMERYPWHSVDSSSFKGCKRFGRQNILWNGFNFKTFSEEEYLIELQKQGHNIKDMTNKQKWFLYDFHSSQSYKLYAENLKKINKYKKFNFLTDQTKLF